MSEQNFNQSMKPFCGNSNATGMFIEATYQSGNYLSPINSESNPEITGKLVETLMLAKNYNNKAQGMDDNDIHNNYVDFIIRTALYHKELDNNTTTGSTLAELRDVIEKATYEMLDRNLNTTPLNTLSLKNTLVSPTVPGRNVAIGNYLTNGNETFFDYINAYILLTPTWSSTTSANTLSGDCPATMTSYPIDKATYKNNSTSSDLCNVFNYVPNGKTAANDHISKFYQKHDVFTRSSGYIQTIFDDLNQKIKEAINDYQSQLIYHFVLDDTTRGDVTKMINILRNANMPNNKQLFVNTLKDKIYEILKHSFNHVTYQTNPMHTKLDNHYAKSFFNDVIRNWANLNGSAREFYRQHIGIFEKTLQSSGVTVEEAGWTNISDKLDNDLQYILNVAQNKPDTIRINLMKIRPGAERVLFGETLPYIPTTTVKKLWYTNKSGVVTPININDAKILQNIYHLVYTGSSVIIGGQTMNIYNNYNNVSTNTSDFDLNDVLMVKNLITSRKYTNVTQPKPTDTLFVQDMITKMTYYRDDRGEYYRLGLNGEKIMYDKDNIKPDNCAGTMLRGADCTKFVRDCIMSGDNDALSKALHNLKDENMFKVAHSELTNMDPDIAIQILKTFKFKKNIKNLPNGVTFTEPQSFEAWKNTVLQNPSEISQSARQAIEGNPKLCDYLKGVIDFVNKNPAILNPNWKESAPEKLSEDPYINLLKKKVWKNPRPEEMKYVDAKMLLQGVISPTLLTPGRLTNPFSNIIIGNGLQFPGTRTMFGGANVYEKSIINKINENGSIGNTMEVLFNEIHTDLKKAGYVLTTTDHHKLDNSFDELKKTEGRLSELYGMLRTLTDLNSLFRASGCVPAGYVGNVSIDNLRNRQEVIAYLTKNINDVQNCIGDNIANQNSKCVELAKYYTALVDASVGRPDAVKIEDI